MGDPHRCGFRTARGDHASRPCPRQLDDGPLQHRGRDGPHQQHAPTPPAADGQNVSLRWRMGSDTTNGDTGWRVDTITVPGDIVRCSSPVPTALDCPRPSSVS